MAAKGWTQQELARRSGVSQRMISGILREEMGCSIETAQALGEAFGLTGWQMIVPDLSDDLESAPGLTTIIKGYTATDRAGRELMEQLAIRERQRKIGAA